MKYVISLFFLLFFPTLSLAATGCDLRVPPLLTEQSVIMKCPKLETNQFYDVVLSAAGASVANYILSLPGIEREACQPKPDRYCALNIVECHFSLVQRLCLHAQSEMVC